MSLYNSFDRTKHLAELTEPLFSNKGVVTPSSRQAEARENLGITGDVDNINLLATRTSAEVTSTSDGLTTGLIPASAATVIVTSSSATNLITLPGIAANNLPVGYEIVLRGASTGFELVTPASSNETINGVDADGTNQLDVAGSVAVVCRVESATGWLVYVSATLVAPDND